MQCEMCGKEILEGNNVEIEGVVMNVCNECSSLGVKRAKVTTKKGRTFRKETENVTVVKENYPNIIRNARESKNLNQEELAKQLGLKQSELQHFETGKLTPPLSTAKSLEKKLDIKLLETLKSDYEAPKKSTGGLTLGDIIKFKK